MVRDGVLEALPGEGKERAMQEFLEALPPAGPPEIADQVLAFAQSSGGARDDMTVLAAGIWEKA